MQRERRRQQRITKNRRAVYKRTEIDKDSNTKNSIIVILFFASIIVLTATIFFSGFFKINNIIITTTGGGGANIQEMKKEIKDLASGNIFRENIIIFDVDSAEQDLKKKHLLKKITINKTYPGTLEVKVEEYKVVLTWQTNEKVFLINEKGKVTNVVIPDNNDLPKVIDKKNVEVTVGKTVASSEFINFINYLSINFKPIVGTKISAIEIKENLNEITLTSDIGYIIILDTTRDPETELKNLLVAIKAISGKKIQYIDMRVENKVYYK